jgi:hypothetical protein
VVRGRRSRSPSGGSLALQLVLNGVVTEVPAAVSGVFSLNDAMSVVYTYDSEAAARPRLILTQAVYLGAISAVDFSIGNSVGAGVAGNGHVENDDPSFHDAVTFRGGGLVSGGTPSIGSHVPEPARGLLLAVGLALCAVARKRGGFPQWAGQGSSRRETAVSRASRG